MASVWDPGMRDRLVARAARLQPETSRRWGKMTSVQMLAHLNAAMRMALGDIAVAPRKLPIRHPPLKQFIIYLMPFPKSAPTAPELIARGEGDIDAERRDFAVLLDRVVARQGTTAWPAHPAFGRMSRRAWGVLIFRHTNHHLEQFGV